MGGHDIGDRHSRRIHGGHGGLLPGKARHSDTSRDRDLQEPFELRKSRFCKQVSLSCPAFPGQGIPV
jgi:hypothetical protein